MNAFTYLFRDRGSLILIYLVRLSRNATSLSSYFIHNFISWCSFSILEGCSSVLRRWLNQLQLLLAMLQDRLACLKYRTSLFCKSTSLLQTFSSNSTSISLCLASSRHIAQSTIEMRGLNQDRLACRPLFPWFALHRIQRALKAFQVIIGRDVLDAEVWLLALRVLCFYLAILFWFCRLPNSEHRLQYCSSMQFYRFRYLQTRLRS